MMDRRLVPTATVATLLGVSRWQARRVMETLQTTRRMTHNPRSWLQAERWEVEQAKAAREADRLQRWKAATRKRQKTTHRPLW